nr:MULTISPECIES: ribonuclease P protein component [Kineosporia]
MRHSSDFSAAVRKGRRAGRQSLVIHLNRTGSDPASPARVGFVVSKAVGPAVVRNRVKRQLRHITRERLAALPSGALVVVRANPAAAGSTTLAADFDSALAAALRSPAGTGPGPGGRGRRSSGTGSSGTGSPRG